MKSILLKFLNLKLRSKFVLSYIIIILFTVFTISPVNFMISKSALKSNTAKFSQYLIEQLSVNLESRTTDIEDFIFAQFNSSGLNKYISIDSSASDEVGNYNKTRSIDNFLYNLLNSKQYVKSAFIIDKYNDKYYREKNRAGVDSGNLYKELDMNIIKNLRGKSFWQKGDKNLIYVSRALIDPESTEYIGLIVIGIDNSYLKGLYKNIDKLQGGRIILLNNVNSPMVAEDAQSLQIVNNLKEKGYFNSNRMNSVIEFERIQYIAACQPSQNGKWKVLNLISVKELTKNSDILRLWTIITCLSSFLIALLFAILISKNIIKNIHLLIKNIKKISEGNFNSRIVASSKDEIGLLAEEFNKMAEKIYNEQILKKNAEYKALQFEYNALQAQVNPHFLYNTLETINSMAKLKGQKDISEMVYLLGNLLRESISKKDKIIPLKEEIQYIQMYLEIQKITYRDKIKIIYDLDENLMEARIPKFILQPIIENAILHGIEYKIGQGTIIINSFCHQNNLIIEIADDGIGIDENILENILLEDSGKTESSVKHTNVGIKGVDKRIKILYGNSYGLNIWSNLNKGTRVEITMPLILNLGIDEKLI